MTVLLIVVAAFVAAMIFLPKFRAKVLALLHIGSATVTVAVDPANVTVVGGATKTSAPAPTSAL